MIYLSLFFLTSVYAENLKVVRIEPNCEDCIVNEVTDIDCIVEKKGNYGVLNTVRRLTELRLKSVEFPLYKIEYFTRISCEDAKSQMIYSRHLTLKSEIDDMIKETQQNVADQSESVTPADFAKGGKDWYENIADSVAKAQPKKIFIDVTYDHDTGVIKKFKTIKE